MPKQLFLIIPAVPIVLLGPSDSVLRRTNQTCATIKPVFFPIPTAHCPSRGRPVVVLMKSILKIMRGTASTERFAPRRPLCPAAVISNCFSYLSPVFSERGRPYWNFIKRFIHEYSRRRPDGVYLARPDGRPGRDCRHRQLRGATAQIKYLTSKNFDENWKICYLLFLW